MVLSEADHAKDCFGCSNISKIKILKQFAHTISTIRFCKTELHFAATRHLRSRALNTQKCVCGSPQPMAFSVLAGTEGAASWRREGKVKEGRK